MKRPTMNALLDAASFVIFALLTSTGLVLKFLLPPGSGGHHGAGTGHMTWERPVSLLWGMTRHQWGDIHFGIAVLFLTILAFHLFLHWNWIIKTANGTNARRSGTRTTLGLLALAATMLLAASPFLTQKHVVARKHLQGKDVSAGQQIWRIIRSFDSLMDEVQRINTPFRHS